MHFNIQSITEYAVAPRVGAWIETIVHFHLSICAKSHPEWVRGLKQTLQRLQRFINKVAPRVGAWIETREQRDKIANESRTPSGCVD